MNITPFHAKYFAFELTKRSPSNNIQKFAATLLDAQVDLNPHQVEAALFAFRSPLSTGAILADEVGLGKTIEAGLVISQKWAERKRKILIIVPSNLRKQWYQELSDKFYLSSVILESLSFNDQIKKRNLNPFQQNEIIICSYHFARSKEAYIQQINWDLVVIDEAHRLRNVYKPQNKIANSIKASVANSPKILLTATPLQNSLLELFGLVSIIDEYTFGDIKSFKNQFLRLAENDNFEDLKARLQPVCKRTLRRQVVEYIKYTNRIPITQEFIPTEEEYQLYNVVSEYLQKPNLFALPASQRQLMTLILRKLLASSSYAIAGTLESLKNKLELKVELNNNPSLFDEQLSQDFESLEELNDEWNDEEEAAENQDHHLTEDELKEIKQEIEQLKEFFNLANSIQKNSKGESLLTALELGFTETEQKGGKRKAVIFTESRRTQIYLKELLENSRYAGKTILFNGSNNDSESKRIYQAWFEKFNGTDKVTGSRTADTREALVEYFRDFAEIMIATEAAAEGINLQFCSLVVNYDLPWNPQRIEQRIGRCHRYGQKYDVVVVNFLNRRNAADQRVFQLLSEKFRLFSGVFGASDEVLGTIESGVDFEKRIASIYQNCRTEEEIQKAFDELQKEMESDIVENISQSKAKLFENFDEEVHEKLRINLEESKSYLNKYENWLWQLTKYYLEPYAKFDHTEGSFYLTDNPFPEEHIHPGPYKIGKNIDDANTYRIGHPLAQHIIQKCKEYPSETSELVFNYSSSNKKISILEPLLSQSGWLTLSMLTISSFEVEDHLILSAVTNDGAELESEQCTRLFSLPAEVNTLTIQPSDEIILRLNNIKGKNQSEILNINTERNSEFFDLEMNKLDNWAEDKKNSLEIELKELDKDIKSRKTESKKILNLEEKVKAQRQIKEFEKQRNELRLELFKSQDEVDQRKEDLISSIEKRLKQNLIVDRLFIIKWKII
jgi:ERCC4-related helicase